MDEQLLDRDRVFAVAGELWNNIRGALADIELALADQDPHRGRDDRLGAGKNAVEGFVRDRFIGAALRRMPKRLHRADLAVASNRYLTRRQQALGDFALGALEQFLYFGGVETCFARTFGKKLRHLANLPRRYSRQLVAPHSPLGSYGHSRFP